MRITLEQVETLRKKINCDYQTAEKALRKSKGNIDDAILYLKKMENKKYKKAITIIQEIINKLFSYNLLIFKNDKKIFNFPVVLVGIIIWTLNIPLPIILSIGVLAALSEFSFEIIDRNEDKVYEKTSYSSNDKPNPTKEEEQRKERYKQDFNYSQDTYTENTHIENTHTEATRPITPKENDDDDDGFNQIIIE